MSTVPEGINITINIGEMPGVAATKKPKIPPDAIKQRLENLRKGREKKKFSKDIYPKKTTTDNHKETSDLAPTPRRGYYH